MKRRVACLMAGVLVAVWVVACGGGGGDGTSHAVQQVGDDFETGVISGALNGFLRVNVPPAVEGESTDREHAKWIDLQSLSLGYTSEIAPSGSGAGAAAGRAGPLVVTKALDASSPILARLLLTGKRIETVTVELVPSGSRTVKYRIVLTNAFVTSLSQTHAEGLDQVDEAVEFRYAKVTITYTPVDPSGRPLPPITTSYDFSTNTASRLRWSRDR